MDAPFTMAKALYSVSQRTHEIGVRMTLGADRARVAQLFLRRSAWLVVPGLLLGAIGTVATVSVTRSMVYGISPLSPLHLASAAGVMALVGLAATMIPVRRASRVDPLEALRAE